MLTPRYFPYDSIMDKHLKIVFLEPYYGGSHASFADILNQHSRHQIKLIALPARKWKWRMRGAAMWFTQDDNAWLDLAHSGEIDLIICSDMLSVADLRALIPQVVKSIPVVCYFHENQLTYPLSANDERDFQYGMTNITSCLAADAVWFNSSFHREVFLAAVDQLLNKMPDYIPAKIVEKIRDKSSIHYPPVSVGPNDVRTLSQPPAGSRKNTSACPKILWSHRWEYDKNPEPFFEALIRLAEDGLDYELVCLGEQFRTAPKVFEKVWHKLVKHISHAGFVSGREDYLKWIQQCDIIVSTAIQENFGIAMVEAVMLGCRPLMPNRLVYPEIIPKEFHSQCLYQNDNDLYQRLKNFLYGRDWLDDRSMSGLQQSMKSRFHYERVIQTMDDELELLVQRSQNSADVSGHR